MTGPPTQHELTQRQIHAARLARLADPNIEKRLRERMAAQGRWSLRAAQAAESATSIAEQRRTEQAAQSADKAEQAWVLQNAAQKASRDKERSEAAATEAKALLKTLAALQDEAKNRKLSPKETAEQLKRLQRDRDRLAEVTQSLADSVSATRAMRDDPHGYLADFLRRFPSLDTGQPIEPPRPPEGSAPTAIVLANVDRLNSLLESVREAYVEAEDTYLEVTDRQQRLAELAGQGTADLEAKYPGLATRS